MNEQPAAELRECVVCERETETRVCDRCVQRTRDALTLIRDADLETVLESAAERSGQAPVNVLTMIAPGNSDALRPYKPKPDSRDVRVPHGGLVGSVFCFLPYWEHRHAEDGREHYADHRGWNDPLVPLAELDSIAVSWHHALNEPRVQPVPSDAGTAVRFLCDWLLRHLWAVDRAPDVNDDLPLIWRIAAQISNTAGLVNRPEVAPARCFDCGDQLISPYREPQSIPPQGRRGYSFEGREMVETDDGLVLPVWRCANRDCEREYPPGPYWLALKAALMAEAEAAG